MGRQLVVSLVCFATLLACSCGIAVHPRNILSSSYDKLSVQDVPAYTTHYFDQPLDHFDFLTTSPRTFRQRYLVCDKFWDGKAESPVLFYTGNEGSIEVFYRNTGVMFDLAPQYNALVVFAEHRYYGETMPFGDKSFEPENAKYLTSQQALADFAVLLKELKKSEWHNEEAPVVAFGGSYGGMLSAWFRIKYPHIVVGAIAASAPVAQFTGLTSAYAFNKIATKDFSDAGCADAIQKGFAVLLKAPLDEIQKELRLCDPLTEQSQVNDVVAYLESAITYLAMIDYPYPTDFLQPVPAWPVKEVCSRMVSDPKTDADYLSDLRQSLDVFFNSSGHMRCFNVSGPDSPSLGDLGWDYQSCTEMVMPMAANGETDMFPKQDWDLEAVRASCASKWGVELREFWAEECYGGRAVSGATNIVFSNGDIDPWSAGGVLESLSDTVVAVRIALGAHHLDLRAANQADPQCVVDARALEKQHIDRWLAEHRMLQQQPPPFTPRS